MRSLPRWQRTSAAVFAALTAIGLLNASSATAAVPVWEPNGYLPTCDAFNIASPSPLTFVYSDSTAPTIVSFTKVSLIKIGITTKTVKVFSMRVKDVLPSTGTIHDAELTYSAPLAPSTTLLGKLTYLGLAAVDRYSSFQLSGDLKTLTPGSSGTVVGFSQLNYGQTTYVALETLLSNSVNRTRVSSGRSVTFTGVLTRSDRVAFIPLASTSVKLQKRPKGSTRWSTVATKSTNSSGRVSFTTIPTRTADYRLVYAGKLSAPEWYAPITSSSKRITVV